MRKFFYDNKLLNQVTVITVSMFRISCFGNIHLHVKLSTKISGFWVQEKKERGGEGPIYNMDPKCQYFKFSFID